MADTDTITKYCAKCGETKPHTEFNKNTRRRDGLTFWCKCCNSVAATKWAAANCDKVKAIRAKWEVANQESLRIKKQNRRARESGGKLSKGLAAKLFKLQRGKCACCGVKLVVNHLDHIIPLALGGPNDDLNMQLLCPTCNQQKHAKHPVDFMQERGFLL